MAKRITFVSPVGVAVFPHITTKDTEGTYATNKYTTRLELAPKDFAKVKAQLKAIAAEFEWDGIKNPKLPIKADKDGNECQIYAKSNFLPLVIDAKKHPLFDPRNPPSLDRLKQLAVRGGSKIKIGCNVFQYDKGISLQLETVQVIERAGGASLEGFDEEEGYDAFNEAESEGFGEEGGEAGSDEDYDL